MTKAIRFIRITNLAFQLLVMIYYLKVKPNSNKYD